MQPEVSPVIPPTEPAPAARSPFFAVSLLVVATFLFSCLDSGMKHLTTLYDVPQVAAARYAVQLALTMAVFAPRAGRSLYALKSPWLVIVRGSCIALATLVGGFALQRLPVPEMVAIFYLAPLVLLLLSGLLLGEPASRTAWIAAAAGFVGVVLIARPGGGLDPVGVGFALMAAGFSVGYMLLSRLLATGENAAAMQFYMSLVGLAIFAALLPWTGPGPTPGWLEIVLLPAVGALGFVGHYMLTIAYRHAPAPTLAPFNYVHLFWAGMLGWLLFSHVPQPLALAGMGLIAIGGVIGAFGTARRT